MQPLSPARTALIVIDMQKGFEEIAARGLHRNNPDAEEAVESLLGLFRERGGRIIHIRHASTDPNSVFRPDRPGFAVMDCARERPGEAVVVKSVNSAFIGTDLEGMLRRIGVDTVLIVGATTNHCVETTTRTAGNLGFRTLLVRDAAFTFERTGPDGDRHMAEDIHAMSLSNLNGEFAEIVRTDEVFASLG
jgi:nicotinamidase-related amidase